MLSFSAFLSKAPLRLPRPRSARAGVDVCTFLDAGSPPDSVQRRCTFLSRRYPCNCGHAASLISRGLSFQSYKVGATDTLDLLPAGKSSKSCYGSFRFSGTSMGQPVFPCQTQPLPRFKFRAFGVPDCYLPGGSRASLPRLWLLLTSCATWANHSSLSALVFSYFSRSFFFFF